MKCPKCGNEGSGKFCSECGAPVEQKIPVAEPISPPEEKSKPVNTQPVKKKISKVEIILLVVVATAIIGGLTFYIINSIHTQDIERKLEEKANSISNIFDDTESSSETDSEYIKVNTTDLYNNQILYDGQNITTTIKITSCEEGTYRYTAHNVDDYKEVNICFYDVNNKVSGTYKEGDYLTASGYCTVTDFGENLYIAFVVNQSEGTDKSLFEEIK